MRIEPVRIEKPEDANVILGQSHFIKTAEDLYEAMIGSAPGVRFGIAFCEASQERLVRVEGNDDGLRACAADNALRIGAGHSFIIVMRDAYPINVLRAVREVPEVATIFCATANDVEAIVVESESGRGIMGVIDGQTPLGVEGDEHVNERRGLLRKFGYKL
jgi:adenosine/AMP kinase